MVKRYDYPTIDFAVQGWDAIWNTVVEMLQDTIVTREVITLGESVSAYQALYQGSDSKWYKAVANGVKQPCQGLAVESGMPNDQIRIHRMGRIINTGWNWTSVGAPVFLHPSAPGDLTQTPPNDNVQIIGYAMSATSMITALGIPNVGIHRFSQGGTLVNPDGITGSINIIIWEAPYACRVVKVKGYRVGGTGAAVNARRNGTLTHLSSNLSLTTEDTWMDGGEVQNGSYDAGDKLEIMIVSVSGAPTQIAVKVEFTRP